MIEAGLAAPPYIDRGLPAMLGRRCSARLDLERFRHYLRSRETLETGTEIMGVIQTVSPVLPYVMLVWAARGGIGWVFVHKFEITGLEE